MFPVSSTDNVPHRSLVDSKDPTKFRDSNPAAGVTRSDVDHFLICEFCAPVFIPSMLSGVSLLSTVCHILQVCAGSQMCWIAAARVGNAGVNYKKSVRYVLPMLTNPGKPVRHEFVFGFAGAQTYQAVSLRIEVAFPRPALIGAVPIHFGPESPLEGFGKDLLKEFGRDRLRLHDQGVFGCATLSARQGARAFSF